MAMVKGRCTHFPGKNTVHPREKTLAGIISTGKCKTSVKTQFKGTHMSMAHQVVHKMMTGGGVNGHKSMYKSNIGKSTGNPVTVHVWYGKPQNM